MVKLGRIIYLFLTLIILTFLNAKAEDSKEEAIFNIKYGKISDDYIVYSDMDSVYIPFEEILDFLKIYYIVNPDKSIKGYVNVADSAFFIDFNNKIFTDINGEEYNFDGRQWFSNGLQNFVRTDLFADIFKLNVKSYFNQLTVYVKSDYELPVLRAMRVEYISNNFQRVEKGEDFGPMISDRTFTILNGGIFDYSFATSQSPGYESYSFNNSIGLAVLGGEFMYNLNGNTNRNDILYEDRLRWQYLFDNVYVNTVSIGDLFNVNYRNSGVGGYRKRNGNIRGIQITNEDAETPNVFSNYVIEDIIEPEWNVELYLSDQLYDVQKADLTGRYRFEIPISYGTTKITVKYYGPNGEFISEDDVLNIPNDLLPAGDFRYVFSAGEEHSTKRKLIDGSISMGLSDWATTSIFATKEEATSDYTLVSQSAINIFNAFKLNVTATNTGLYELALRLPKSFFGNHDIIYTYYDQSVPNPETNMLSQIKLLSSLNIRKYLPFTFSIMATRSQFINSNTTNLNNNLIFNYSGINLSIRHYINIIDNSLKITDVSQTLNTGISYNLSNMPRYLSFLNRTRFQATSNMELNEMEMKNLRFSINNHITKNIYFNCDYNFDFIQKISSLNLGLNMNLPYFRNTNSADFRETSPPSYSSQINGSVEFDSYNLRFNFINSMGTNSNYGRSSAAVRFYTDNNLNKEYDEGDDLIPEAEIYITNGFVKKMKSGGYYILSNLRPGSKYNVKLKPESMPNPLLIPEYAEFSFIAEPYTYKAIDIPCQMGGMIEGSVQRLVEGKFIEQGGG